MYCTVKHNAVMEVTTTRISLIERSQSKFRSVVVIDLEQTGNNGIFLEQRRTFKHFVTKRCKKNFKHLTIYEKAKSTNWHLFTKKLQSRTRVNIFWQKVEHVFNFYSQQVIYVLFTNFGVVQRNFERLKLLKQKYCGETAGGLKVPALLEKVLADFAVSYWRRSGKTVCDEKFIRIERNERIFSHI